MSQVRRIVGRCAVIMIVVSTSACSLYSPSKDEKFPENSIASISTTNIQPAVKVIEKPLVEAPKNKVHSPPSPNKVKMINHDDERLVENLSHAYKVPKKEIADIVKVADKYGDSDFPSRNQLLAIIAIESGFHRKASHKKSVGLMQINIEYHSHKFERDHYDIDDNIRVGVEILKELKKELKTTRAVIISYNMGSQRFKRGHFTNSYFVKYKKALHRVEAASLQ